MSSPGIPSLLLSSPMSEAPEYDTTDVAQKVALAFPPGTDLEDADPRIVAVAFALRVYVDEGYAPGHVLPEAYKDAIRKLFGVSERCAKQALRYSKQLGLHKSVRAGDGQRWITTIVLPPAVERLKQRLDVKINDAGALCVKLPLSNAQEPSDTKPDAPDVVSDSPAVDLSADAPAVVSSSTEEQLEATKAEADGAADDLSDGEPQRVYDDAVECYDIEAEVARARDEAAAQVIDKWAGVIAGQVLTAAGQDTLVIAGVVKRLTDVLAERATKP